MNLHRFDAERGWGPTISAPLPEVVGGNIPGWRGTAVACLAILEQRTIGTERRSFRAGLWPALVLTLGFGFPYAIVAQGNPPSPSTPQAPASTSAIPAAPNSVPQASQTAVPGVPQPAAPGSKGAAESGQLAGSRPALATSVWQERGLQVTDVRFEGVTFSKDDALLNELTQKAGTPLDPDRVRADLRRLFASGRYRDISVRSEHTDGGTALVYAGIPRYYVGRVQIDGVKSDRLVSLLEFATKLEPGTAYTEAQVPAAVASVKESLAHNGFYQATVVASTTKDNAGEQMNFVFQVETGPQARVGEVAIEGQDPGFIPEVFREKAKLNCNRLELLFSHGCRDRWRRSSRSRSAAAASGPPGGAG